MTNEVWVIQRTVCTVRGFLDIAGSSLQYHPVARNVHKGSSLKHGLLRVKEYHEFMQAIPEQTR